MLKRYSSRKLYIYMYLFSRILILAELALIHEYDNLINKNESYKFAYSRLRL